MANDRERKRVPVKEGIKTLGKMLPYVSEFKVAVVVIVCLLFVSGVMSISAGFVFGYFIDRIPEKPAAASAYYDTVLIISFAYILVMGVARSAQTYLLQKVTAQTVANIRSDAFNNIVDQDLAFFDHQSSGELQTRIVSDTDAFGNFVSSQIPVVLTATIRLVGGVAGALLVNFNLAVIVLVFLPIVFSPFLIASRFMRAASKRVQKANSEVGKYSGEVFRSIKVTHAYNKKVEQKRHFRTLVYGVVAQALRRVRLELSVSSLINTVAMMGIALILWTSAKSIHASAMTGGQLFSFAYFLFFIVTAAGRIVSIVSSVNFAIGAAEKVAGYLALEKCSWPSHINDFKSSGRVEFSNVQFSYPSRPDIVVLKGINLVIAAGTHVVLVGPSGAGKSTLLELILRLYDVDNGQITVDGMRMEDLDVTELRSLIGFVPQKETLISGTIFENIAYGSEYADREQVQAMARIVGLSEFIENHLPNGYDSDLGEVANRLSGGQKQRLSLARALIRSPKILLLDEANSALDVESERNIVDAIRHWAKQRNTTILTIAHRLSTARLADKIVVMKNGRIIDEGSHEALLERCDVYRNYSFTDLKTTQHRHAANV